MLEKNVKYDFHPNEGLSPEQIAKMLGVCSDNVIARIKEGKLKGFRMGKRWIVLYKNLQEYIENGQEDV